MSVVVRHLLLPFIRKSICFGELVGTLLFCAIGTLSCSLFRRVFFLFLSIEILVELERRGRLRISRF